jgi:hypothetical protein
VLYRPPDWKPSELPEAAKYLSEVIWSGDGRYLLGKNRDGVQQYDIQSNEFRVPAKWGSAVGIKVTSSPMRVVVANDDGVVRVWSLDSTSEPHIERKFDALVCLGDSTDGQSIPIVTRTGIFLMDVIEGTVRATDSEVQCQSAQQDRFSFENASLGDKTMGWRIPFDSNLKQWIALSAPAPGEYWEPVYRFIGLLDSTVGVVEIKDEPGAKMRFMRLLAVAGLVLLCLVEFAAAVWRRHAVPF